jgi:predicted amidohydrolase YtcJ
VRGRRWCGQRRPPKDSVDRAASPRSCHWQDPARTLHATYGETIRMALDACEKIAADGGFGDIPWFSDHAETVTQASLDRIKALGGSVSVQNKMMFQGRVVRPGGGPERASDQIL